MPKLLKNDGGQVALGLIIYPHILNSPASHVRCMAKAACAIIALAAAAQMGSASAIGDSYEHVIAEKGKPTGKIEGGSIVVLQYPDVAIKFRDGVVVSMKIVEERIPEPMHEQASSATQQPAAKPPVSLTDGVPDLKTELRETVQHVRDIVNQPVTQVPRTEGMSLALFPYWFHPGAGTPNFETDDVRSTQDNSKYSNHRSEYASSPLNPEVAFLLSDMAFNSATKIFYVDRTVPKKKLTEQELLNINKLYRIIGRDLRLLKALGENPSIDGN